MAGLAEDILACLQQLAPDAGSGGGDGGGDSAGGWPLAWLLLDLQQLLPPNSRLALKLRSDIVQLAREMEAADRDPQLACRRAAALLAAIAEDTRSTQQLAELLQKNGAMQQLCCQALRQAAAADQRFPEADAISKATWRVLNRAAATLEVAEHCVRSGGGCSPAATEEQLLHTLGEAAEGALRALQVATQLSASIGNGRWALEQHGGTIAAVLWRSAAAASCLPPAAKDILSQLLAHWAEQVPLLLCEPWRYRSARPAALGITGKLGCIAT